MKLSVKNLAYHHYTMFLLLLTALNCLLVEGTTKNVTHLCPAHLLAKDCCRWASESFQTGWWYGRHHLTDYFKVMKFLKCPQLDEECREPTFNLTEFTSTVYEYFCSYDDFRHRCAKELTTLSGVQVNSSNWKNVTAQLITNPTQLTERAISNPCFQMTAYEIEASAADIPNFTEIVEVRMPFCGWIWSGFRSEVVKQRDITEWNFASNG